jgi:hypothetical protein
VKTVGNKPARKGHRSVISIAATVAVTPMLVSMPVHAGTTAGEETVSFAGSTALRNWFVVKSTTFTDVNPGQTLSVNGVTYPASPTNWAPVDGGTGSNLVYQLAPSNDTASNSSIAPVSTALRFEYHESGSVEGILELANDQIATQAYVTNNIDRNPTSGNNVWVNYNQIAPAGSLATSGHTVIPFNTNASAGAIGTGLSGSQNLGDFYPNNATFSPSAGLTPVFNTSGGNVNGGQNAVQVAVSDAIPLQVFANPNTTSTSSTPWTATPQTAGYGQGNSILSAPTNTTVATLGSPQYRQVYQSPATLNMSAGTIDPRTGTAFGTGPWNSAGLGNLNTQLVAVTATIFVANPGTGLTQLDRTDAQFLETTGRLANGAAFNMTTRDVNSGTRDVAALETGIDPTWAAGVNDDGNGNLASGQAGQVTIGSALRFSNKTAGGNQLRPTVQSNRFAIGTLSINDASGNTQGVSTTANEIRALSYSDSTDGSAPYVAPNYYTIAGVQNSSANPNTQQYTIFQNEQFVTVKAPDANYSTGTPTIQGDNSTGDVAGLLNNTLNSVTAYNGSSAASPAAGLLTNGYIIPQLMAVQKGQNGLNQAGLPSQIVSNIGSGPTNYNSSLASSLGSGLGGVVSALAMGNPAQVTSGSSSSVYGGNSLVAGGVSGFNGQISLTNSNYLLGNFNQNGVRDFFSAIVLGQQAQAALESSGAGNSAFTGDPVSPTNSSAGAANSTVVTTGIINLDAINGGAGAKKGDLIVLGDLNGDGKFDGKDLYDLAVDASLTSASNRPVLVYTGGHAALVPGTGTLVGVGDGTTDTTTSAAFGAAIAASTTVLNKNVALDYLQSDATTNEKLEARMLLTVTSNSAPLPAGAVLATNSSGGQLTDAVSGLNQITFDPTGANAFNKSDVNQDGVVDFNDAVAVDSLNGKSFSSLSDSLTSSEPTPVTGLPEVANLVLAQQVDGTAPIGSADLAVVNAALTGSKLTTNWYAYLVSKTGPGTISWQGSAGSKVNVNTGASMQISAGTVQVMSAIDPFTDNNTNAPATATDTSKSLAITVTGSGKLEYTSTSTTGIVVDRLSGLNVAGGTVTLDSAALHANHTLLIANNVSLSGTGNIDLGSNDMIIQGGNVTAVTNLVKAGLAGTAGVPSIVSTAAANDPSHLTTIGVIVNGTHYTSANPFDGVTGVAPGATDVLVKDTYYGDANLSGTVDSADYTAIDNGFLAGGSLTGWANGDFNYDGVINGSDYTLIDNAFNTQGASLAAVVSPTASIAAEIAPGGGAAATAVPEPTALGLLGVGVGSLLGRRRRRA